MNPVIVGLDIGTNCVRVASLEPGVPPLLRVFGQVALPVDAVRNGEIVDAFAVTTTIGRLWAELSLSDEAVRVAISGPRLIARVVDLPSMDDEELLAAVQQKVADLVTYPVQDAVFDFQVLGPAPEDVGPLMDRVLVAIAHRATIERVLDAVEAAGLVVDAVDLVPLALVRSLGREAQAQATSEAIVSLGAGTTTIVVHNAGVPVLLETMGRGGRRLTESLVRMFGTFEAAETAKRRAGISPVPLLVPVGSGPVHGPIIEPEDDDPAFEPEPDPPAPLLIAPGIEHEDPGLIELLAALPGHEDVPEDLAETDLDAPLDLDALAAEVIEVEEGEEPAEEIDEAEIWEAIEPSAAALITEITRVMDDYRAQPDALPIRRVVVTGGGSLLQGLDARLANALNLPIETGRPRLGLDVADIGFPVEEYPRLDPYLAVPLGIAAGGLTTQRRIDLMPLAPPIVRPSRGPVLLALIFMLTLIAGMVAATVIRQSQRSQAEASLSTQVAKNRAIQREIDNYSDTAKRAEEIDAVRTQIFIQLSYDVAWSRIIQELSVTTPNDVFMTGFQGTSTAPGSSAPGVAPLAPGTAVREGEPSGGITVNAAGLGFPSVSAWLQRVSEIKALRDVWITNAVRVPTAGGDAVVFSAAANLTPDARSNRYAKEQSLDVGTGR